MKSNTNSDLKRLSPHLFWDTNIETLDWQNNKSQLIQKVLEYGLLADWLIIKQLYGLHQIVETVIELKSLEPKALNFIAELANLPKENFRCYTTRQLTPPHWDF